MASAERSELAAAELLMDLRSKGFTLRVEKGKLFVSPFSQLTNEQRRAVQRQRAQLIELLAWEGNAPKQETLRAWFESGEEIVLPPPPPPPWTKPVAPRRIVLVGPDDWGPPLEVLCDVPDGSVRAKLAECARRTGRRVAGEYFGPHGWARFIWAGPREATNA